MFPGWGIENAILVMALRRYHPSTHFGKRWRRFKSPTNMRVSAGMFQLHPWLHFIESQLSLDFNWKDAEWLLGEWTHGPTAIKGVVRSEDAMIAQATGFSANWGQ